MGYLIEKFLFCTIGTLYKNLLTLYSFAQKTWDHFPTAEGNSLNCVLDCGMRFLS